MEPRRGRKASADDRLTWRSGVVVLALPEVRQPGLPARRTPATPCVVIVIVFGLIRGEAVGRPVVLFVLDELAIRLGGGRGRGAPLDDLELRFRLRFGHVDDGVARGALRAA